MSTEANEHESHEQWWNGLSAEGRYRAIETVRLEQDPDYPHGERPTGERAEWVRRQPEYLERWAGADHIAQQDDVGFGPRTVPDAHADTQPIVDDPQN